MSKQYVTIIIKMPFYASLKQRIYSFILFYCKIGLLWFIHFLRNNWAVKSARAQNLTFRNSGLIYNRHPVLDCIGGQHYENIISSAICQLVLKDFALRQLIRFTFYQREFNWINGLFKILYISYLRTDKREEVGILVNFLNYVCEQV